MRSMRRNLIYGWRNKMRQIACPKCGSPKVYHYRDAYVLRTPVIGDDGKLSLLEYQTNEYDDNFFECLNCGERATEAELISAATNSG